jgi:hypothetical protein
MKIVNINTAPTVCDADGMIRPDVTDINKILDNIDQAEGRNDALRAYIYALRDQQHAIDQSSFADTVDADGKIDRARAAVAEAFDRLIVAEFSLNRLWRLTLRDDS